MCKQQQRQKSNFNKLLSQPNQFDNNYSRPDVHLY